VRLYERWRPRDVTRISIRNFDAVVNRILRRPGAVCSMERSCSDYFVVEHNGDVYPCDFFVEPALRLGNVLEDPLLDLRSAPAYRTFARRKSEWSSRCGECEYLSFCAGGCLKYRRGLRFSEVSGPAGGASAERTGEDRLSVLCAGWKQFYGACLPGFDEIAEGIEL
jgi:uncharacterized protein